MSVESVNGKTGVVTLTASNVEAVPTSEVGQPSGVASLNSGGELPEAQLPSSVVSGSQAIGGVKIEEVYVGAYVSASKVAKEEDVTAEVAEALKYALEHDAWLVLPNVRLVIKGTLEALNPTSRELRIRGSGSESGFIDKNTTGPALRYKRTSGRSSGTMRFTGWTVWIAVQKAAYNSVEGIGMENGIATVFSEWGIEDVAAPESEHAVNAGLYLEDITEVNWHNVAFRYIYGHEFYFTNGEAESFNGGNFSFTGACCSQNCLNGGYIDGAFTTNNGCWANYKATGPSTYETFQYYEALTSGLPVKGAKTLTVKAGLASAEQPKPNQAIVLFSFAGAEVVHAAAASPYNAGTGEITLRDEVTKEHTGHADLRVLWQQHGLITNSYTPNMNFTGSHFENRPIVHINGSGNHTNTNFSFDKLATNSVPAKMVVVGGNNAGKWKFDNCTLSHVNGEMTEYAMVAGLWPAGSTGSAAVEIDEVVTFPPGEANMEKKLYLPLFVDGSFGTFGRYKVRTAGQGVQRDTFIGDSSFRSTKVLTGEKNTALNSADVLLCEAPAGANQEDTLSQVADKTVTAIRIGSSAHNIILKPGTGAAFIDGVTESATYELTSSVPRVTFTYNLETKKWYVVAKG